MDPFAERRGIGRTRSSGMRTTGDVRRTARLLRMAASLAETAGGKVAEVVRSSAEQRAAYDFPSNSNVQSPAEAGAPFAAPPGAFNPLAKQLAVVPF